MRIDCEKEKERKKKHKSQDKSSNKNNSWENEIFMFMQKSLEAALNKAIDETFKDWK